MTRFGTLNMNIDEKRSRFLDHMRERFIQHGELNPSEAHIYDEADGLTALLLIGLDKDGQRQAINNALVDMITAKKSQPVLVLHAMEIFALFVRQDCPAELAMGTRAEQKGEVHKHPARGEAIVVAVEPHDKPIEMWWAEIERTPSGGPLLRDWQPKEYRAPYPGWKRYFPHAVMMQWPEADRPKA